MKHFKIVSIALVICMLASLISCFLVSAEAGFTEVDTPDPTYASVENIARKETTVVTYGGGGSDYKGNLADGVTGPTGYDASVWYGFKNGYVQFDFGAIRSDISNVTIHTWPANKSGIKAPTKILIEASDDGENWVTAKEMTDFTDSKWASSADEVLVESITFDKQLSGRFVKVTFEGPWTFVSEVEINAYTQLDVTYLTHAYLYDTNSANIITPNMGKTLGDVADKYHEWWSLASCVWSVESGAYVVTDVSKGTGVRPDTNFRSYVIPENGFVLAAHYSGGADAKALANFIDALTVGDKVYVAGVDLANISKGDELEGAAVSTEPLAAAYTIETKQILTSVGYASGDVTIFFPFEKDGVKYNTPKTIRGILGGEAKDYNYYGLAIVGADNKITMLNNTLADGTKGDYEIPDGGFAIGVNGGSIDAYVGDKVCLFGVDRTACAGMTGSLTNAYFAIEHTHEYIPGAVPPSCLDDGYTSHICRCGDKTANTDIVPALGHRVAEGAPVHVVAPTCTSAGYSYQECAYCPAQVKVEGSDVAKLDHAITDTTMGYIIQHKCGTCDLVEYTAVNGDIADIQISHLNRYNWGTFQAMIITGDDKTVSDVIGQKPYYWIMYVVEKIDGEYVATAVYQNADEVNTTKVPAGGFLLYMFSANDAYKFGQTLLGYHFYDVEGLLEQPSISIDTNANPDQAKHIYAASPEPVLTTEDYTIHPSVNTSIITNAKTIVTDPSTAANYNPNWSGRVLLAPTETPGIYTVVETQKPNGSAPTFTETIGEGYIILLLHGESGQPDGTLRDNWLALKPGTKIVISGYNFEAGIVNDDAYATIYTDQVPVIPQPTTDPSDDSSSTPSDDSSSTPSDDQPNVPDTGDNGIVAIVILAVVALLGSAVIIKVRH